MDRYPDVYLKIMLLNVNELEIFFFFANGCMRSKCNLLITELLGFFLNRELKSSLTEISMGVLDNRL